MEVAAVVEAFALLTRAAVTRADSIAFCAVSLSAAESD